MEFGSFVAVDFKLPKVYNCVHMKTSYVSIVF
jgi:hypothetical protein